MKRAKDTLFLMAMNAHQPLLIVREKTLLNSEGKRKKPEKEAYLIVSGNETWQFSISDGNAGGIRQAT